MILVPQEHAGSMINKEHDELNFDFPVDGEVFSKLYYLVEGIYLQLSCFLSSESNPHTKLAFSFEKIKKHTERMLRKVLASQI